ncbi:hypothetical protein FHG89_15300 [Micromonospora orduensis]|uniref:Uncharacterized protein n=1 Tax=Micromonospora orduensis TaxID=1420891 RepID=A0A5C4QUC4_9ACTN|nr:hypothetical protein [Micromonospora orduensis]TNH28330.1 hypothetical protein FHG89_15300 [Micromonospora orduensis]
MILLPLLASATGCAAADPAVAPRADTAPSAAGATPSAPAERPRLCGAPPPAEADEFRFNRDAARRDPLVGVTPAGYTGGIASFDDLDVGELAELLELRFVDPYDRQNAAPTVWEIFRFLCAHPDVRAAGYVVSLDREDYRTSIESIYAGRIDAALSADATAFCATAEAITVENHLECFWD